MQIYNLLQTTLHGPNTLQLQEHWICERHSNSGGGGSWTLCRRLDFNWLVPLEAQQLSATTPRCLPYLAVHFVMCLEVAVSEVHTWCLNLHHRWLLFALLCLHCAEHSQPPLLDDRAHWQHSGGQVLLRHNQFFPWTCALPWLVSS